jgi:cobalamin biosynthesis Mg chelatase CobN
MQNNSATQSQSSQNNYQPSVPISLYKELAAELQSAQTKVTSLQLQNEHLLKTNQTLIREFTKEFEAISNSSQQLLQFLRTLSADTQEQPLLKSEIQQQEIAPEPKLQDFPASASAVQTSVHKLIEPVAKPQSVNYSQVSAHPIQDNQRPENKPQESKRPENKPRPTNNNNNNNASKGNVAKVEHVDLPKRAQEPVGRPKHNVPSTLSKKQAVNKVVADAKTATVSPVLSSPASKLKTHQEESSTSANLESTADEGSINGWWLALTICLIVVTSFGAGYFLMRPLVKAK